MTKLNRSETVTVRLDPRLNYLAELAGRAQRRTKSSFIEWAVQEAVRSLGLPDLMEWCPIGTAPVDGTGVILWAEGRAYIAWFDGEQGAWRMDYDETVDDPTHWMPLPQPPVAESDASEVRP